MTSPGRTGLRQKGCHILVKNWIFDDPFHKKLKFIYSEKATKFCEIFPLLLTTVHTVKSKMKISQNFVAFSKYMNFTYLVNHIPITNLLHKTNVKIVNNLAIVEKC